MSSGFEEEIVITGISGRYPKSDNVEEFSKNLYNGIQMSTADDGRWPVCELGTPAFTGKIKSLDKFDNEFFDIGPEIASSLDHQLRLLLEVTYETIIDSGYDPEELRGSNTAFYYGSTVYETPFALSENVEKLPAHKDCVESMVSYQFDLRGPVCQFDTACASSMSAFHEAYKLLKSGTYENTLVAGFCVPVRIILTLQFLELKMISKEGLSKSMDKSADGFGRAEAVVVIFLQKAINARRIYARVVNSKSNNDGYKEEGISFPSRNRQGQLMKELYMDTKLDPQGLPFVEAHATGTQTGDPVELGAIYDVFCDKSKPRSQPLLVGALKSCMGHSEGASGLCAITKAILILQNKSIPPNQLFAAPNPNIEGLMNGSLVPVNKVTPFSSDYIPVNGFGFGGSNIHTLIQKVNSMKTIGKGAEIGTRLITCCGRSPEGVNYMLDQIIEKINLVNIEFLHLLNKISHQKRMHVRGASLVSFTYFKEIQRKVNQDVTSKAFALLLTGHQSDTKTLGEGFLQLLSVKESLNELISFFGEHKICINNLIRKDGVYCSEPDKFLHNACVQFLLLDTLKRVGVKTDVVFSESFGKLLEAYWKNTLDKNELFSLLLCIYSVYDSVNYIENQATREMVARNVKKILEKLLSSDKVYDVDKIQNLVQHICFDAHEARKDEFLQTLLTSPSKFEIILEIGTKPKDVLTTFASCFQLGCHDCNQNLFDSMDLLRILGAFYLAGQDIHIQELYDKVETQPAPCETLTISSMLKWNHAVKHALYVYPDYHNPFRNNGQFSHTCDFKTLDDRFIQNHKIDGQILFPATGYLVLAWYVGARFHVIKPSKVTVEFRDVSFHRAVVMSNNPERFYTRYLPWNGRFTVSHSKQVVCMGTIILNSKLPYHEFPVEPAINMVEETLSLADIYKELRIRGYDYGYYFQNLLEATMDGHKGLLAWKNTQMHTQPATSTSEIFEPEKWRFLRNWISFADSALQMSLLAHQEARCLLVLTKIEKLVCDPIALQEALQIAETREIGDDQDKPELVPVVEVRFDKDLNVIAAPGLYVKGMKVTYITRKPQVPTLQKYLFLPYEETCSMDGETNEYLTKYFEMCRKLVARIRLFNFGKPIDNLESSKFDDSNEQHSLYKYLKETVEAMKAGKEVICPDLEQLNQDVLIGSGGEFCRKPRFLRQMVEIAIYAALYRIENTAVKVTEVNLGPSPYCLDIISLVDDIVMKTKNINYTLVSKDLMQSIESETMTNVQWNGSIDKIDIMKEILNQDLLIWVATERNLTPDTLLSTAASKLSKGSYLLLIFEDDNKASPKDEFSEIFEKELRSKQYSLDEIKAAAAADQKFKYIFTKELNADILPHTAILLQHSVDIESKVDDVWVHVSDQDYEWIEPLKIHLQGEDKKRVILTSSNIIDGGAVIGFVKSIGLEQGGHRVRCVANVPGSNKLINIDKGSEEVKQVLEKDLIFNLFCDGVWGSFVHLPLPSDLKSDKSIQTESEFAYIKDLAPGDLSSLAWVQDKNESLNKTSEIPKESIVDVYYAALNFRDVMTASGRLPPEALALGLKGVLTAESLLGSEFVGRDGNGKRIMGYCQSEALTTRHVLTNDDFVLQIPDQWTFEEASTILVAYATCYYGMIIRGRLQPRESILIHAETSIGIAAISIALSMNCTVYTMIDTSEKGKFIKKEFPSLNDQHIFHSRSTEFEEDILKSTDGRGVDMVLNSLSEEKLQASVRCLTTGGRFIEVGKHDSMMNNKLIFGPFYADQCISFHGVHMDAVFGYTDVHLDNVFCHTDERSRMKVEKTRLQIENLLKEGINNGTVRPLPRTIFDAENVEKAFRYLASGKHMEKVIIQVQKPPKEDKPYQARKVKALKFTYFHEEKSYIIIGGFGGLGLELASWMAFKGARKIILNSKIGPVNGYHRLSIERLRSAGAQIIVSKHDVSSLNEAKDLIDAANKLGPVGGVFNCALVIADGPFNEHTSETFSKVCIPKTRITKNLDQLTRFLCPSLDHFVFFSSVTSGRGNLHQTNYAFANSLAEAICQARKSNGLPGLAIQWGVIGDVGYVQRVAKHGNAIVRGTTSQRLFSCFETLDRLMQSPNAIAASMVKATSSVQTSDNENLLDIVSHFLGMRDVSKVDTSKTLAELGMDSLMVVEIRQVLDREHDIVLTTKEVRALKVRDVKKMIEEKGKRMSKAKIGEQITNTVELSMVVPKNVTTKLNSCLEGKPIFALGPLEGNFDHLRKVVQNFNRPFIALNWTPDLIEDNSTNKVLLRFTHLMKLLDKSEEFQMVAVSFGGVFAIQLVEYIKSRNMGKFDKLVLIDFEPGQLKDELKSKIGYKSLEDVSAKASIYCLTQTVSKLTSNNLERVTSDLLNIEDQLEREQRAIQLLKDARLDKEIISTVIQSSQLFVQKVTALEKFEEDASKTYDFEIVRIKADAHQVTEQLNLMMSMATSEELL